MAETDRSSVPFYEEVPLERGAVRLDAMTAAALEASFGEVLPAIPEGERHQIIVAVVDGVEARQRAEALMGGDGPVRIEVIQEAAGLSAYDYHLVLQQSRPGDGQRELTYGFDSGEGSLVKQAHELYDTTAVEARIDGINAQIAVDEALLERLLPLADAVVEKLELPDELAHGRKVAGELRAAAESAALAYDARDMHTPSLNSVREAVRLGFDPPAEHPAEVTIRNAELLGVQRAARDAYDAAYVGLLASITELPAGPDDAATVRLLNLALAAKRRLIVNREQLDEAVVPAVTERSAWERQEGRIEDVAKEVDAVRVILGGLRRISDDDS